MPYEGEKANPYGYGTFLSSDLVRERLQSFLPHRREEEEEEEMVLPLLPLEEVPGQKAYPLTHALTIDGSLQAVEVQEPAVEVGFVKVGVVLEDLTLLRKLNAEQGIVSPEVVKRLHRSYSIATVFPGRGIEDQDLHLSGKRKFAKELYANIKDMKASLLAEQPGESLLQVLASLLQEASVHCDACGEQQTLPLTIPRNCPICGGMLLYPTDCLRLQERYNGGGGNSSLYSETMSTLERLLMAGLIKKASAKEEALQQTAFITDGSLALFQAVVLVKPLLEQVQSLSTFPLLVGVEKTGSVVELMKQPRLQQALKPGHVLMITPALLQELKGGYNEGWRTEPFYGRRFAYRSRRGDKVFVFTLPPRSGGPAEFSEDLLEEWERFPTVKAACTLFEETATDVYGPAVAALTSVAEANSVASIPLGLGSTLLRGYLEELFTAPSA